MYKRIIFKVKMKNKSLFIILALASISQFSVKICANNDFEPNNSEIFCDEENCFEDVLPVEKIKMENNKNYLHNTVAPTSACALALLWVVGSYYMVDNDTDSSILYLAGTLPAARINQIANFLIARRVNSNLSQALLDQQVTRQSNSEPKSRWDKIKQTIKTPGSFLLQQIPLMLFNGYAAENIGKRLSKLVATTQERNRDTIHQRADDITTVVKFLSYVAQYAAAYRFFKKQSIAAQNLA